MSNIRFYLCVLLAVALFFANQARACTTSQDVLDQIEYQYHVKLFVFKVNRLKDYDDTLIKELWVWSGKKAHIVVVENFSCKELDISKV
jgi:hypothetical protein